MKKKLISSVSIAIILVLAVIHTGSYQINNAKGVLFQDKEMEKIIVESSQGELGNKLCAKELRKVEELNIGYTGYYETLSDIEKCQQLDTLIIGRPQYTFCNYYFMGRKVPESESKERIQQIEKELGNILESCSNMRILYVSNESGTCDLESLNFLKNGKNLEALRIEEQHTITNYSDISECVHLKHLSLYGSNISELSMINGLEELEGLNLAGTNISEAKDILKFKNLKDLAIENTPLAENEEELALIYQQFPNINFY